MTAIEFAKCLCKENEGKVFVKDNVDPKNVTIYCNRPDQIKIPKGETNWHYEKGMFTNKHNVKNGMYEMINVLPKFYMND